MNRTASWLKDFSPRILRESAAARLGSVVVRQRVTAILRNANLALFLLNAWKRHCACALLAAVAPLAQGCSRTSDDAPPYKQPRFFVHQTFRDDTLQRLANAGATIQRASSSAAYERPCIVNLHHVVEVVDDKIADDLARVLDSDSRSGPPASLEELGNTEWVSLQIGRCRIGRRQLAMLNGAKRLTNLTLEGTLTEDEPLADVESLPALRELWIINVPVGDNSLRFLQTAHDLEELRLVGTRAGDGTLARVEHASKIKKLELTRTEVSDAGLHYISRFSKLKRLSLEDCNVTDAGLEHLSSLHRLQKLDLSGTKVTDVGIRHLRELRLSVLDLRGTRASDACLQYLAGMKLSVLGISGSRITKEGVAKAFDRRIFTE